MDCTPPLSLGLPRKNTGVGCHFLLRRIFLTQGSWNLNLRPLLHWWVDSLPLRHLRSPVIKLTISLLQTAFHLLQLGPERQLLLAACCGGPAACTPGCRAPAGPGGSAQSPPAAKRRSGCRHALASPVRSSILPAHGDCFQRSIWVQCFLDQLFHRYEMPNLICHYWVATNWGECLFFPWRSFAPMNNSTPTVWGCGGDYHIPAGWSLHVCKGRFSLSQPFWNPIRPFHLLDTQNSLYQLLVYWIYSIL